MLLRSIFELRCAALHTPSLPLLYHFFSKVKASAVLLKIAIIFLKRAVAFCRAVTLGWSSGFILQNTFEAVGEKHTFSEKIQSGQESSSVESALLESDVSSSAARAALRKTY